MTASQSKIINLSAINKRKYDDVPATLEKKPDPKVNLTGPGEDELKRLDRQISDSRRAQRKARDSNRRLADDLRRLRKDKAEEDSQCSKMRDRARDSRKQSKNLIGYSLFHPIKGRNSTRTSTRSNRSGPRSRNK